MCGLLQKRWEHMLDREGCKICSWSGGVDPLEILNFGTGVNPGDEGVLEHVRDKGMARLVRGSGPEFAERCK